ncbi:MAG: hypothetical protein IJH39_06225 [Clostridia bacterium]|nr:hypothetical protein [Clostridia bacterium]
MKDFFAEDKVEEKKINKKKIIILILIFIIILAGIASVILYKQNEQVKVWIDKNVFRKEVFQNESTSIELNSEDNPNIYAFNRYIGILNKNKFVIYNSFAKQEKELNLEISNPLFASSSRYLAVAEKKGQKVYSVEDKEIKWEAMVSGEIYQVHVNKNGYVAVVIADTTYKTLISVFNNDGKNIFNTYLSTTSTTDASISNDNKYLAIAEVDTSGTMIQSKIKIISIEKAQKEAENSIIKTYNFENNKLVTNIKYQDKNKLICMFPDSIHIIENENDDILIDNMDKKITFSSIDLENNIANVEEQSTGLFTANSVLNIININNKNTITYTSSEVTKEVYTYENMIALNMGAEVHFINTNGWLSKRYIANQEITNIVISNSIAGIIYRDKIEIINL